MKNIFLLLLPFLLFACSKDSFDPDRSPDLIGTWKVTEQFSDPGDGSGGFVAVDYERTFTFLADGRITSDRDLCSPLDGTAPETDSEASYDVATGIITPDICEFTQDFSFELDGRVLTFRFTCFEGCALRLRKLR